MELLGEDVCAILKSLSSSDNEAIQQHAVAGPALQAETARLGMPSLKDVLPRLQVGVLDKNGCFAYSLHPVNKVALHTSETCKVRTVFTVCTQALQWGCNLSYRPPQKYLTADLFSAAATQCSFNEHRRIALEALTLQCMSEHPEVTSEVKKSMVTVGCMLATFEDAAVREQAVDLMIAAVSSDTLEFVKAFFASRQHHLGTRVVQEVMHGFECNANKEHDNT